MALSAFEREHCRCELLELERDLVEVHRLNPRCRVHGRPDGKWRVGDPLRKYAKVIDGREEWPEEVEARLLAELRASEPPPPHPPPSEPGEG